MPNEINLISNNASEADKGLFFGPITLEEKFITFDPSITDLAKLLVLAELFPSISQAKKNGFSRPITGFHHVIFGKQKIQVWILNIQE